MKTLLMVLILMLAGCGSEGPQGAPGIVGEQGPAGPAGSPGIGTNGANGTNGTNGAPATFVKTLSFFGSTYGNSSYPSLNTMYIIGSVHVDAAGNKYATAAVQSGNIQSSGTEFYGPTEANSSTSPVSVVLDRVGSTNNGSWTISVTTNCVVTAVYSDPDIASPQTFSISSCYTFNY